MNKDTYNRKRASTLNGVKVCYNNFGDTMNNMFLKFIRSLSKKDIDMKHNYEEYRKLQSKSPLNKIKTSKEIQEENLLFRIFSPKKGESKQILIYIHGGGWVTGTTKNYSLILQKLANELKRHVIAIEYRLAPEYPFPHGFNDCYEGIKLIYKKADKYNIDLKDTIIMGDSAGANLATAICIKAKKTKDFKIRKEILLYPIVQTNFKQNKKYKSIEENGYDYFLTKKMINDYLELYLKDEKDYKNKLVAPLLSKWLFHMPETLIITADLDPLRDEGLAYAKKLKRYWNKVEYHNIKKVIHGFINNPIYFKEINKTIKIIKRFVGD